MVCLHEELTNKDKARVVLMTQDKQQLIEIFMTAVTPEWIDLCASYYHLCIDTEYPPKT